MELVDLFYRDLLQELKEYIPEHAPELLVQLPDTQEVTRHIQIVDTQVVIIGKQRFVDSVITIKPLLSRNLTDLTSVNVSVSQYVSRVVLACMLSYDYVILQALTI